MDKYLAQFGATYENYIRARYIHGGTIAPENIPLIRDEDHRGRYRFHYKIDPTLMHLIADKDYRYRYRLGGDIPDDKLGILQYDDHYDRYYNGYNTIGAEPAEDFIMEPRYRYRAGRDIKDDEMCQLEFDDYVERFREGFSIPSGFTKHMSEDDIHLHYRLGGDQCPDHKMSIMENYDYMSRAINGYLIPDSKSHLIGAKAAKLRLTNGYDPEMRPYSLSYLLGFSVPCEHRPPKKSHDRNIHDNCVLNEACICALADLPFAISNEFAADFEYVTGLKAPNWLELRDPAGEIAFRTEVFDTPIAKVKINCICDGLASAEYGECCAETIRGTVYLAPIV